MEQLTDIRIPVTVGGITFKNPFYVASGPTTKTVEQLIRIHETGWAAASIKLSIDPAPYINRKPRYGLFPDRKALAFTTEKRLTMEEGLTLIRQAKPLVGDLILLANITYAGEGGTEGWANMAKKFQEAGADIIELNMCCPNMSYNLELTSGGSQMASKQTGASMGQNAAVAAEIVRAVKEAISIPLFVKLTPEGGHIAQVAHALYAAGADAVGGTGNRLGLPPIDLEHPEKAFYHLQEEVSMSCYCSSWLKPLAQRDTYEIRKTCGKAPAIMAAGGVTDWRDGVEMILCGANLVGVCAETLISGYDIVRPMIRGLSRYMQDHGYSTTGDFRSLLVDQVKTATDVTLHTGFARIRDPNLSAPCKSACPHHVPVQAYVRSIARGDFRRAYELITEKNALQEICARVCAHPCEDACVRGSIDAPVRIRALKRFVLEYGRAQGWKPAWAREPDNGHRAAVVGAGPCGLSCAAWLRKAGYEVTVFDREAGPGGTLRYALPSFAMDRTVLDREAEVLRQNGVRFSFETEITDARSLLNRGFEQVLDATGRGEPRPGGTGQDALAYLRQVALGEEPAYRGAVAVIGKGFEALEAARCALRLGAERVTLLCPGALPARTGERELLEAAREEGLTVLENCTGFQALEGALGFVCGDAEMTLTCGRILEENPREPRPLSGPCIKPATRITNVISAITAGKNAAAAIDRAIRGGQAVLEAVSPVRTVNPENVRRRTGYVKKDKNPMELLEKPRERVKHFAPAERVMTVEEAQREASRCLSCGCGEGCQLCKTICTDFAPKITGPDALQIQMEKCVACGMCFQRCPNHNIEMVDLGEKV